MQARYVLAVLASQGLSRYTYNGESCREFAVKEAPFLSGLNIELCIVEPLEDFFLNFDRIPLLGERATHVQVHDHGSLVEMSRDPIVTPSNPDGVTDELLLAAVPRVAAEAGRLIWTREVGQRTAYEEEVAMRF